MKTRTLFLAGALCATLCQGQELTSEQKQQIDAAIPKKAPAKPKRPRRMLVSNLAMRNGKVWRGSSNAALPVANYAVEQMGKRNSLPVCFCVR